MKIFPVNSWYRTGATLALVVLLGIVVPHPAFATITESFSTAGFLTSGCFSQISFNGTVGGSSTYPCYHADAASLSKACTDYGFSSVSYESGYTPYSLPSTVGEYVKNWVSGAWVTNPASSENNEASGLSCSTNGPPIISIAAFPSAVNPGGYVDLEYGGTADPSNWPMTCTATGFTYSGSGYTIVYPTTTTTYTFSCTDSNGTTAVSTTVTVPLPPPVPTASLSASPTSITKGNSSTLTWGATDATSCTGTGFSTGNATSGSIAVSPTTTTTYSVSCTGAGGTSSIQNATVTVTGPLTVSCSPSRTSVATNQAMQWFATASLGSGSGYTYTWTGSAPLGGMTGASPSVTYTSVGTMTGSVTVRDSSGTTKTAACSSSVSVYLPVSATLTANPTSIPFGGSSTLTWTSSNAASCSIDNGVGSVATGGGTISVSPPSTTTYTITCTGAGGVGTGSATATVTLAASNGVTLSSSPTSIASGGSSTLTWTNSIKNSTCSIDNGVGAVSPFAGGSISVSPSTTTTYTITCIGSKGTGAAAALVTVNAPDLTAGSVTPTAVAAGAATTFSATVSNSGTAPTGAGFTDLFQKANDALGTGSSDIGTYASAALTAGGSNTATLSYAFPAGDAGTTKYLRVCADKNSAGSTGTITESDETNNCGAWTAVTVSAAASPSVSCTVDQTTVVPNTTVHYTATPANGATSPYTWNPSDSISGLGTGATAARSFSTAGTYGMQVNATGAAAPGFCPNVTVSGVPSSCGGAVTPTISAAPTRVTSGLSSSINYTVTGMPVGTKCTLSGPGAPAQTASGADSSCNISGSFSTGAVTSQSVYTITCAGATAQTVVVNVIPKFQEF